MEMPGWFRRRVARLRAFVHGRRRDAAIDEEIAFHLSEDVDARVADGLSPEDARLAARRDFGSVARVSEDTRDVWVSRTLDALLQDLRYGVRMLVATPAVSLVAILSLALGIGATTAIFSVVETLLLRPLPVHAPGQLVMLGETTGPRKAWTNPIWEEIRRRPELADGAFAVSATRFNLASHGESEMVDGLWASGSTFDVLGVGAVLGRTLTEQDDRPGGGPDGAVAVISHDFWQRRFTGAPDVLGRSLTIEQVPFTIVGVAAPTFFGVSVGRTFDVAIPIGTRTLVAGPRVLENRSTWWLRIFMRLRPGQSAETMTAMIRAMQPQIRETTLPGDWHDFALPDYLRDPMRVVPAGSGDSGIRERYRRPLLTVLIVVALVLLIACANLANLLLGRAAARRRELSLRVALGAPRGRLVRQLLTESLLLAGLGALAGLFVAHWGSHLLVRQLWTSRDPVFLDLALNWRVLGFALLAAVGTALLFGTAPALQGARAAPGDALKTQGRGLAGDAPGRFGQTLVAAQVALSLVLLTGAGLLLRTFVTLATSDRGFDEQAILVSEVELPTRRVAPARRALVLQQALEAVTAIPGVSRAVLSSRTPLDGNYWNNLIELRDRPSLSPEDRLTSFNVVGPGFFQTYGTRLIAGRDFNLHDSPDSAPVAIVNEAFARRFTNGRSPIGLRVRNPWNIEREVVGYVRDVAYEAIREPAPPTLYVPFAQQTAPGAWVSLSVRAAGDDPTALTGLVAAALTSVSPDLIISSRLLSDQVGALLVRERVMAMLSVFFGVLALLLAALGLYGVTMHAVGRRRAEMGVRLALGATPGSIAALVLRRVVLLVGAGALVGALVSLGAARLIAPLLYGIAPHDSTTLVAATFVLALVGLVAGWLPARRAARIDAATVLRDS
jgi:putative ABC transport system permease protein